MNNAEWEHHFPPLELVASKESKFLHPIWMFFTSLRQCYLRAKNHFWSSKAQANSTGKFIFISYFSLPIWYIIGPLKTSVEYHAKEYLSSCQHLVINTNVTCKEKKKQHWERSWYYLSLRPERHQRLAWCCYKILPKQLHFTPCLSLSISVELCRETGRCHWRNSVAEIQKLYFSLSS